MNGMITTDENFDLDAVIPRLKAYKTGNVVERVTCSEPSVLRGNGYRVALMDFGVKSNIPRSLNERGCQVTIYPAQTTAEEILAAKPDGICLLYTSILKGLQKNNKKISTHLLTVLTIRVILQIEQRERT